VALVVAGVVVLAGVLVMGLVTAVVVYGLGLVSDQVQVDLRGNPVMQAHVGEVIHFDVNITRSMMEPDAETFVFDVKGVKGSGRVIAKCVTVDADREKVTAGRLRLDSGTEYDLFPREAPPTP
jgi:hypothetical protein